MEIIKPSRKIISRIRELNQELGTHVAILADLQGPKIRVGDMGEGVLLKNSESFETDKRKRFQGSASKAQISYPNFANDVNPGEKILLDDGKIELLVKETNNKDRVHTTVLHGGMLTSNKGVNLPNTYLSQPSITEKDIEDLRFALSEEVDWVALSFVRKASDVHELRELIRKEGNSARIIAKIEKPEAIENIDSIIEATDALMIARGDLGVEIPMENVPLIQKMLIKKVH